MSNPEDDVNSFYGLLPAIDRLDIYTSNIQSVTNLITRGRTALSVYDNVALFYTV